MDKHIAIMFGAAMIGVSAIGLDIAQKCGKAPIFHHELETETASVRPTVELNWYVLEQETGVTDIASVEETHETETETEQPSECEAQTTYYKVNGLSLDHEVQDFLRMKLASYGIEEWMPYALCTMYQESTFKLFAENPNGLDKGILQYRLTYWDAECNAYGIPGADIFDFHAQINIYAKQTADRLAVGCSAEETISRHHVSDWGEYNSEYVAQVMQWLPTVTEE